MKTAIFVLAFLLIGTDVHSQTIDKKFVIVWSATFVSTAYDIETTFTGIKNGASEGNPVVKPLIKAGKPVAYAVEFGVNGLLCYLSYKNKKQGRNWYLSPSVLIGVHGMAGTLNLRF